MDRLELCRQILNTWIGVTDAITTDKGMFLSKHGADKLRGELTIILDTMLKLIAENEDKAKPKRKPVRVCTMSRQGPWCNECTQFFNCDILSGIADKQVIYEEEVDDEEEWTEEDFWQLQEMCNG